LVRIEFFHRFEETFIADRDQLREVEAVPLILLDVGNDEAKIGSDEALGSFLVATLYLAREAAFFFGFFD